MRAIFLMLFGAGVVLFSTRRSERFEAGEVADAYAIDAPSGSSCLASSTPSSCWPGRLPGSKHCRCAPLLRLRVVRNARTQGAAVAGRRNLVTSADLQSVAAESLSIRTRRVAVALPDLRSIGADPSSQRPSLSAGSPHRDPVPPPRGDRKAPGERLRKEVTLGARPAGNLIYRTDSSTRCAQSTTSSMSLAWCAAGASVWLVPVTISTWIGASGPRDSTSLRTNLR